MYLTHNGVVRSTARALVRQNDSSVRPVTGMQFSYDKHKTAEAIEDARLMDGVYYVRVWLNEGELAVGDDIMYVLVGGDTRPHVLSALEALVAELKTHCVTEREQFLPQ